MTIRHDAGNSAYRLVVIKAGSAVDAIPTNLIRYNGNQAFGSGNQITPGNYVMTGGQNSTTLPVTGLTPGVTYHVAVFGFNGNNYPVYVTTAATASITLPGEPSTPGSGWQISGVQGNAFRAQWTGGDGSARIVIARKNAPVTATPTDGVNYTASPVFGSGTEISTGQFVVYNDVNRLIDLQNLEIGATYHFAVFEYNTTSGTPDYLVSSFLSATGTTALAPSLQTSNLSATNIQNTQATINFSIGDGTGRLFIMRAGSPVNALPQDLILYAASTVYGNQEIGTGNYIVQRTASSSSFAVTSLSPNTQYFVSAFEYNGSSAPVYLRPGSSFSFTTTGSVITPPAVNASTGTFSLVDGNKLTFNWINGDGAKRIVVASQGSPVSFTPANGTDYPADPIFANGNDLGSGQFVVYNGAGSIVSVTSLLPSTVYHFKVFEYNGNGATTSYLTTGALTSSHATAIAPVSGSSSIAGTVTNGSLQVTWNNGPGAGRIVVMKEGSAAISLPANLSKYPANAVFGSGSQIGAGEYVVYGGSSNTVTVTGLSTNKTYYYTVFEYNGVDAPVYNTVNVVSSSTLIPMSLPLTWLYFTFTEDNDDVRLIWGTADEINTRHFVVERSTANGNFISIATVQAIGSGSHDYHFTDHTKPTGTVSYRIKQVDIDNHFTYSKQVIVKTIAQQASIKLYPNPAPGYTRISLPQGVQQASMHIYNMEGKQVMKKIVINGEMLSLQQLLRGIYNVVIDDGENRYSERLVVQ
jgi:hypothetical protein